jgi:hypothetical protein
MTRSAEPSCSSNSSSSGLRVGEALRLDRRGVGREQPVAHRRRVDDRDHAVDGRPGADRGPGEGLDERLGQREARGLDDDVVGRRSALEQPLHRRQEVVGDGAADAAVRQLDDVVLAAALDRAADEQLAVDPDLAELVDDDRDPSAAGLLQDVPHEAGLPRAEKTCDDRRRHPAHALLPSFTTSGRPATSSATRSAKAATL